MSKFLNYSEECCQMSHLQVDSLLKRVAYMKSVQSSVPELTWPNAVDILSVNGMDVDKACYALQRDWLQPLYESINSEHKKLRQDEMVEIKTIVSNKDETLSNEVKFIAMKQICALSPFFTCKDSDRGFMLSPAYCCISFNSLTYLHYY